VVALLREHRDGGPDDAVTNLLFLGGGETRHVGETLQSERLLLQR
jgi:hypothetical protein